MSTFVMLTQSGLSATLIGAVQGAVSVLLTASAGFIAARFGLLDQPTVKRLSNLSSLIFLPCMIIVEMGPQLTVSGIKVLWIMPLWGLVSSLLAHFLGWMGQIALKLPSWTIVASGRANANALPLLLLQSLENTGILDGLARPGESSSDVLKRARGIVLLNSIVQQMFTFSFGPPLLRRDRRKLSRDEEEEETVDRLRPGSAPGFPIIQDQEHVGLLDDQEYDGQDHGRPLRQLEEVPETDFRKRLPGGVVKGYDVLSKPFRLASEWLNPPLVAGIVALILGVTPSLHHAFLDKDGLFYNTITSAVGNIGNLFVALQMFTLGAQLQLVPSVNPGIKSTSWVLMVRYAMMPAIAFAFVWFSAGKGLYPNDKLLWFLLILIPCGPSAMLLANLSELMNVDQGAIAGMLTISYILSPIMAIVAALALQVVEKVGQRG